MAELMVARAGMRKAVKALTFMVAWEIARRAASVEELTMEAYRAHWSQATASAYRERAAFRLCFPEEETPTRIMGALVAAWDDAKLARPGAPLLLGNEPVPA